MTDLARKLKTSTALVPANDNFRFRLVRGGKTYRLLAASGAYGQQSFTYDPDGNRVAETSTAGKKTLSSLYAYPAASNRLASIAGANAQAFAYDSRGNLVASSDGKQAQTFAYDARNRNSAFDTKGKGGSAAYLYNALGERAVKDDGRNSRTHFIYDTRGNLIAEADSAKGITKEYIYIDNLPVAVIDGNAVYYIHADHLGQPQKMTDDRQRIVWDRVSEPFGETVTLSGPATLNFRFPGQYFDAESGLAYNGFRSYIDGRYTQSDPIGLLGGLNTYGYVGQNPLNGIDPYGLYGWYDFQMDYSTVEINALQGLAGLTDTLTWGASQTYRQQHGLEYADTCSTSYKVGEWAPALVGGARLAYAGAAKAVSLAPGLTGSGANAARNALKKAFRLGLGGNYKMYSAEKMFTKYGTDDAVKAAAGRTDPALNAAGAGVVAGFAANNAECGCNK